MADTHQPLESEKYLMSSIREEQAIQKKAASNVSGIKMLIIFLLWSAVGYCVIKTMPSWMPVVEAQLHEWLQ